MAIKMYLYLAVGLLLIAGLWRLEYLSSKVDSQKLELKQGEAREAIYKSTIVKQDEQIEFANKARTDYLSTIESGKNETKRLADCIRSGTCGLRVRAVCPAKTTADPTGTVTADAGLAEESRQNYYAHRNDIGIITANLELCIKTLQNERE